jgi:hypothetical protein
MRSALALVAVLVTAVPGFAGRDFDATPNDFRCITDGKPVPGKHFYISNKSRRLLRKASASARRASRGCSTKP